MSADITVYTCLVGDYDAIIPPKARDPRLHFICFTDNKDQNVEGWEFRNLQAPEDIKNAVLVNRYHKIFPHKLGLPHPWSIYIDANIAVTGRISQLVDRVADDGAVMGCPKHPQRSTVREEIDACFRLKKIGAEERILAKERLGDYLKEGMPSDASLTANYLLIRKHADNKLQKSLQTWWSEVRDFVHRDQLPLPYALWKHGISPHLLKENALYRNGYFYRYPHSHAISGIRGWLYRHVPILPRSAKA